MPGLPCRYLGQFGFGILDMIERVLYEELEVASRHEPENDERRGVAPLFDFFHLFENHMQRLYLIATWPLILYANLKNQFSSRIDISLCTCRVVLLNF